MVGGDDGLEAVAYAELGEDCCDVGLDGGFAEVEPLTDLGVGQPAGHLLQDLVFAFGHGGR